MDNPSFMARVFHLYGLYLAFISLESLCYSRKTVMAKTQPCYYSAAPA